MPAYIYNNSNGGINAVNQGTNHTVDQGENGSVGESTAYWGVMLTNFTGCVQSLGPGGSPIVPGNTPQIIVTSDQAPTAVTPPAAEGTVNCLQNNLGNTTGSTVVWAYNSAANGVYSGNLASGDFQAVPLTDDLLWYGFYLTSFSGYVTHPGLDGVKAQGYSAELSADPMPKSKDKDRDKQKEKKNKH